MTRQQGRWNKFGVRIALAVTATIAVALWVPHAEASPESDAHDAITAAWQAAGGDGSALGAPQGDVYPAGAGFVQDFVGGKMFFTPETGARAMYGAILDKYESLGGAADGGLGFPNIDEVAGLVPGSRDVTFSGADHPVIFWTPEHGAHLVRGPINAGWDELGSSTGALGVPVEDETYDGDVVTQKFSAGQLSWNISTKAFTTVPPELAEQLAGLQVQADPGAAIDWAWRAAGGAGGPLGAKRGEQYQVGSDGVGQDFAGGKVYFSPATGAHAVAGDILAKYESLGGPAGSELGFPIGNEADGSIPGSRVSTFAGSGPDDEPVIFSSPDNGAFVVRGAMKAAWDKLDGASGKLGAPVGDQAVEGDTVSQKFTGGKVSWNRVSGKFSTDPSDLAKSLSGLQVPGLNTPGSPGPSTSGGQGSHWHWWWLLVAIAIPAVLGALAWAVMWLRERRRPRRAADAESVAVGAPADVDSDDQWQAAPGESDTTVRLPSRYAEPDDDAPSRVEDLLGQAAPGIGWTGYGEKDYAADDFDERDFAERDFAERDFAERDFAERDFAERDFAERDFAERDFAERDFAESEADESDDVDTAPTRIPTEAELGAGRHAAADQLSDPGGGGHPMMHLPLNDPYQAPDGYPVKANVGSGLYYTADSPLYEDTLAEVWFSSEEAARLNGFIKAR